MYILKIFLWQISPCRLFYFVLYFSGIPNNLLYRPVMAPNPNIPFEVYLDMIGRPRYPPLGNVQANLLVRPKPLMFFPYNAMLVSNSMTIRPYPMNMVHPSIRENPKETSHMDARTAATTAATATTTARPLIEMKSTNIKKYKCQFCGRGFSRSNTLITHEVSHFKTISLRGVRHGFTFGN